MGWLTEENPFKPFIDGERKLAQTRAILMTQYKNDQIAQEYIEEISQILSLSHSLVIETNNKFKEIAKRLGELRQKTVDLKLQGNGIASHIDSEFLYEAMKAYKVAAECNEEVLKKEKRIS